MAAQYGKATENPLATRNIDEVIEAVRRRLPDVTCEQLKKTHPADDDGLWFFDFCRDRSIDPPRFAPGRPDRSGQVARYVLPS